MWLQCYHTITLEEKGVEHQDPGEYIESIAMVVALATDLYSTLVLDLDTVGCFLELQEIIFEPKNTQYPPVDFRSLGYPAQSALEKASSVDIFDRVSRRP
jgi:hypothetical protein